MAKQAVKLMLFIPKKYILAYQNKFPHIFTFVKKKVCWTWNCIYPWFLTVRAAELVICLQQRQWQTVPDAEAADYGLTHISFKTFLMCYTNLGFSFSVLEFAH